jgi:3-oxoacyl-[acyl-carrier protein] reductase
MAQRPAGRAVRTKGEDVAGRPVAIVTGGGTGIGAASVRRLAERGYDVLINYARSRDAAEALATELIGSGADALAMQGDVAEDADCRALTAAAFERWGRIDALVHSAATTQFVSMADLDGQSAADFQKIYGVNVIGAYQMARAAQPALSASDAGAIVMISSVAALAGSGSSYAYAASKGALNSLTIALARNLAPVRVNAVLPGAIDGDWLRKGLGDQGFEATRRAVENSAALGKMSSPDDIGTVVAWLVCDASVITGQLISADAGALLGRAQNLVRR